MPIIGRPDALGYFAICAIRSDDVRTPNFEFLIGQPINDGGGDVVIVLNKTDHLGREANVSTGLRRFRREDGLEPVLGQVDMYCRTAVDVFSAMHGVVPPRIQATVLDAGQAFEKDVVREKFIAGGLFKDFVFGLQITKHFHRTLIDQMRPRAVGRPPVFGNGDAAYTVPAQSQGRGRPCRPDTHD